MARQAPIIGEWYQDLEQGQLFEVVAIDDMSATLAVQYLDGEIGEFDFDSWYQLSVQAAAPPEDWASSYEIDFDEFDSEHLNLNAIRDPLNQVEADSMLDFDDLA